MSDTQNIHPQIWNLGKATVVSLFNFFLIILRAKEKDDV